MHCYSGVANPSSACIRRYQTSKMAECIKEQSTNPWYPLGHVKQCAHEVVLGGPRGVSWLSQSLVKLCTHEVVWGVHGSPVWKQ